MIEHDPDTALEQYFRHKGTDVTDRTLKTYKCALTPFAEWLEDTDVETIRDVTPRLLNRYKTDMADRWANSTYHSYLSYLREFIGWCESNGLADNGTAENMLLPPNPQASRDNEIDTDTAADVQEFLNRFEYASRSHAIFSLIFHTCIRVGSVHSIDLRDVCAERDAVRLEHRPDTGTFLKNGSDADRWVSLSDSLVTLLEDYQGHDRHDVVDDTGRTPLFTTEHGRPAKDTLARDVNAVTRPCVYGDGCPHGRDTEACIAARRRTRSYECPSTEGPHAVRRGAITHHLRRDVPKPVVSDRADVSVGVLDNHYNELSQTERMEVRRGYLDNL